MKLPSIKDIKDIKGKRVLLRVDFNVPIEDGEIQNDFRIQKILPTIDFLREKGALVTILSHHSEEGQSLRPIFNYLEQRFALRFVFDMYDKNTNVCCSGETLLVENLRFWKGEKENDLYFAKHLASLGDIYINEAFGVSHRKHASIVSLPTLLPSYAGLLFEEEVRELSKVFNPTHPSLVIFGGAKISTKLPLAEKFIDTFDYLFIGGALSNNFFKEDGYEIGVSLYDSNTINLSRLRNSKKVLLPIDVVVKNEDGVFIKTPAEVEPGDMILDAGPKTVTLLKERIDQSRFVLLNGPIGDYKIKGFEKGTIDIIEHLSRSKVTSITGGGDTVTLIFRAGVEDHFDFISTGGGAMLRFLTDKTLPGIEALKK